MAEEKKVEKTTNNETITGWELKNEAILIYLIPVVGFIFSFLKKGETSKEARFHYNQVATSFILSCVCGIIPFVGWVILPFYTLYDFIMRIMAIVKIQSGEQFEIPLEIKVNQMIYKTEE